MYVIIYNPKSANGNGKRECERIIEKTGETLRFVNLFDIEDEVAYINALTEEEIPVIAGGDGTINHFANLPNIDELKRKVLYFPAGSGNDFWNDVKSVSDGLFIDLNPYIKDLPEAIINGKTYKFLNGVSIGLDGWCCEVADEIRKSHSSDEKIDYVKIAVSGLLGKYIPRSGTVTCDGESRKFDKIWICPIMNGRYYGGGVMAVPDQYRLAAERTISCLVLHGANRLTAMTIVPETYSGRHVKHKKYCYIVTGHEITVTLDTPCATQVDGETIYDVTTITLRKGELPEE